MGDRRNRAINKYVKVLLAFVAIAGSYHVYTFVHVPDVPRLVLKPLSPDAFKQKKSGSGTMSETVLAEAQKLLSPSPSPAIDTHFVEMVRDAKRSFGTPMPLPAQNEKPEPPVRVVSKKGVAAVYAEFNTTMGTFLIKLDHRLAPMTVENFIELAEGTKEGRFLSQGRLDKKPYYDGLLIFRVVKGYFVQMGDPQNSGLGGPGYYLKGENETDGSSISQGMVVVASNGPTNSGSQFFIALGNLGNILGKRNTVFGHVVSGMEVLKNISEVKTTFLDKPLNDITIKKVTIRRTYL